MVASHLVWVRRTVEEAQEWREFLTWHGGLWAALLHALNDREVIY